MDFQRVNVVDGLSTGLGLGTGGIADVENAIMKVVGSNQTVTGRSKITLVLDGLDFLLAATGSGVLEVLGMVGELREVRLLSNYMLHRALG